MSHHEEHADLMAELIEYTQHLEQRIKDLELAFQPVAKALVLAGTRDK